MELLFITAILSSQQGSEGSKNEKALLDVFVKSREIPEMAKGLQYFLKKVVSKTDIAGSKSEKETVKWGCRVVGDTLALMVADTLIDG